MRLFIPLFLFGFLGFNGTSAKNSMSQVTIAVVDTGVYSKHPEIESLRYINFREKEDGRDNDRNGYIDDRHGWNFISMSPLVFDSTKYPLFEEDFFTYYEIRRKRSLNISTSEEDDWYKEKRKDDVFQKKRSKFRRFSHATHVAGLASGLGLKAIIGKRNFEKVSFRPKIMGITYLGDAESGPAVEPEYSPIGSTSETKQVLALNEFLTDYLKWQKNKFKLAMDYSAKKAQVVNCSFGISPKGANSMIDSWWEKQFPNQESSSTYLKSEKEKLTFRLRSGLLKLTKEVVDLHPNTLFVFSAGNTKLNTEVETHYPSGVRCDHCLSVGATLGTEELASFSNFAATRVSLFAPGVAMQSIVPFNRRMPVNGTSQAAPQVAYAAALILQTVKSMGKKISGSLVKKILEESVDLKPWLKGKGKAAGIINPVRAAYLTNKLQLLSFSKAKSLAYKNIQDLTYYPVQKSLQESLEVDELFSH